jgi:periplasmic protein TonB
VFEDVTKRQTGTYAARRAGWVFGSTAFQLGLVAVALFAGQKIKAAIEEKPIDVKFVRAAPPPRPPPPPPAAAPPKRKDNAPKPPDKNLPPPPPPQALIQPKDVQAEMKVDTSPKEPEYAYGNTGEGVIGGVVGAQPSVEDAPAYATAGYKKPVMTEPGCVQRSVRISADLLDYVTGPVTVKFAIGRDGMPSRFDVMSAIQDQRIANAIWQAVKACKWTPGADAQGRPTMIWVILPVRFQT